MNKKFILLILTLAFIHISLLSFAEVNSIEPVDLEFELTIANEKIIELNEKVESMNATIDDLTGQLNENEELNKTITLTEKKYDKALEDLSTGYNSTITGVTSIINTVSILFGFFFLVGGIGIPVWRKLSDDKQQKKIIKRQEEIESEYNEKFLKIEMKMELDNAEFNEQFESIKSVEDKILLIETNVEALSVSTKEASDDAKISSLISESYSLQEKNEYESALKILENGRDIDSSNERLYQEIGILHYNWGTHLSMEPLSTENETLYELSLEKFEESIKYNPNYLKTYNNYGIVLCELAELNKDELLYTKCFEKYEEAIKINPKHFETYNNYGVALYKIAKLNNDEKLYEQCFEQFEELKKINPGYDGLYSNYGAANSDFAKLKNDKNLFKRTFELYKMGYDLNGKNYNLACGHALLENKTESLKYLKKALDKKEISVQFVLEDDDWINYLEDEDFLALLDKYK